MKFLLITLAAGSALLGAYYYLASERQAAWDQGYRTAAAEGTTALETLKREHVEALLEQAQAIDVAQAQYQHRSQEIERHYLTEGRALQSRITELENALDDAYTDHYRPGPNAAPEPVPECVFTAGWLRDYNAALGGVRATKARAGQSDATTWPPPGAATEFNNSGINQRDLLRHAQRYGQWCQANTQQLTALIDVLNTEEVEP